MDPGFEAAGAARDRRRDGEERSVGPPGHRAKGRRCCCPTTCSSAGRARPTREIFTLVMRSQTIAALAPKKLSDADPRRIRRSAGIRFVKDRGSSAPTPPPALERGPQEVAVARMTGSGAALMALFARVQWQSACEGGRGYRVCLVGRQANWVGRDTATLEGTRYLASMPWATLNAGRKRPEGPACFRRKGPQRVAAAHHRTAAARGGEPAAAPMPRARCSGLRASVEFGGDQVGPRRRELPRGEAEASGPLPHHPSRSWARKGRVGTRAAIPALVRFRVWGGAKG